MVLRQVLGHSVIGGSDKINQSNYDDFLSLTLNLYNIFSNP
ncbi:hypothetical protein M595_2078 [Lyngbya aestuarii BL J]|uniref:Uncharacterized protein n=1 Tax=Lyngbya aestuarii BL J TaxID=1348334 RepID=U7QJ18_9CYAN|nr:hypothetical protein M595_2078 [Lyngbya aestuarii BL J]